MRLFKRLSGLLLLTCLLCTTAVPARAAQPEDAGYTIRVFAGAQGQIDGKEEMVSYTLGYKSDFNFNWLTRISLKDADSKYYVKGIRVSGNDNAEAVSQAAFQVTKDQDYVVAYGIKGEVVEYRVRYVDTNGNELLPERVFRGNVGDKPVVPYEPIDGYRPQAYNLGKTLSSNAAENLFTFVYTRVRTTGGGNTTTTETETTTVTNTTVVGGGTAPAPAAGAGGGAADAGGADAGADGTAVPDGGVPAAEEPQEYVDLDDTDVPLAGFEDGEKGGSEYAVALSRVANPFQIMVLLTAAIVIGAAVFIVWMRKKRNKNIEE